jgi:hypothetical protein
MPDVGGLLPAKHVPPPAGRECGMHWPIPPARQIKCSRSTERSTVRPTDSATSTAIHLSHAKELRCMVRLGVMTCQRESDLVYMRTFTANPRGSRRRQKKDPPAPQVSIHSFLTSGAIAPAGLFLCKPRGVANTKYRSLLWSALAAFQGVFLKAIESSAQPSNSSASAVRSERGLAVFAKWREWLGLQVAK